MAKKSVKQANKLARRIKDFDENMARNGNSKLHFVKPGSQKR